MDAFMYFITEYYWLLIVISAVLFISVLGIYVEGRRVKAEETGEKIDNKVMEEAEKKREAEQNIV